MIDGLKPYPAYRPSGVPWLGEVPEHWQVRRLQDSVSALVNGTWGEEPDGIHDLVCVRVADFDYASLRVKLRSPTVRSVVHNLRRLRSLAVGDLLLEKSGGGDQQPVGRVVVFDHGVEAVCSNFVARMRPVAGYNPSFLAYYHATLYAIGLNERSIKQTTGIQNLDSRSYLSETVAFPPLPEQSAIVRFLTWADRRIRRAIRARQNRIELLEEHKQALIHQAVTGQIDVRTGQPYPAYKPSGVEWLGEVPEHWELKPLKRFVPQVTVGIVIQPARLYVPAGVPCLRSLNISSGTITSDNLVFITKESNREHRKSQVSAGDIVVVRTGHAGTAAVVTREFDGANCVDLLIVRKSPAVLSDYLLTYFNSWTARTDVQYRSVGAIQAHYNTAALANLIVPIPPTAEQQAILDNLAQQLRPIARASDAVERELALIHEYRTRLIRDAVTGNLDVREAATHLPDEPDEPEPPNEEAAEAPEEAAA